MITLTFQRNLNKERRNNARTLWKKKENDG